MDFADLRKNMVEEQLASRGIRGLRVLETFAKIERHKFVPPETTRNAYADFPLPIGENQTISQPYIVALMTECLDLTGKERVLEIGTGSGYQTAILAELAKKVYTIERFESLGIRASAIIKDLGYKNIKIKIGDGTLGWPEEAPFDRIIITAATARIPLPLTEQLEEEGKIIAPLGENFTQILTLGVKKEGRIIYKEICGCVFVPLVGKFAQQDN